MAHVSCLVSVLLTVGYSLSVRKMAEKGRLSVEQRSQTVLFFAVTNSVVEHRRFRGHFGTQWAPSPKSIHRLYDQFKERGSVLEKKRDFAARADPTKHRI